MECYNLFLELEEEMMSMKSYHVCSMELQYASVRNAVLEKDLLKQGDMTKTFMWISRPKHNTIERYFPSMVQMNYCRICCAFAGPLGLLTESFYSLPVPEYSISLLSKTSESQNRNTYSSLINTLVDEVSCLPLHSFDLNDATAVSRRRPRILPFSDVNPRSK